jgi:hypothetical protein
MKKVKFDYINPRAIEIEARVIRDLGSIKGMVKMSELMARLGLESNRPNQTTLGHALKRQGWRKLRTHPEKEYFYTRESGEALRQTLLAEATVAARVSTQLTGPAADGQLEIGEGI